MLCKLFQKGPIVRVLLVGANSFEPSSDPLKPKISSIVEIAIYIRDV